MNYKPKWLPSILEKSKLVLHFLKKNNAVILNDLWVFFKHKSDS